jgi:hypothetical protein
LQRLIIPPAEPQSTLFNNFEQLCPFAAHIKLDCRFVAERLTPNFCCEISATLQYRPGQTFNVCIENRMQGSESGIWASSRSNCRDKASTIEAFDMAR